MATKATLTTKTLTTIRMRPEARRSKPRNKEDECLLLAAAFINLFEFLYYKQDPLYTV
ncbi:Uncharacterised protein [Legionella lansingensis]|uniref:Uncharacterized protein n=1 Tax=Legionella lansingensis TaxID=45067 RepID=A0A0W0V7D6_9GAMM|nr:hypothetical protein Llan_2582 [Legionella lansingensis]SNV56364.1 Uncharacterised protein [Legionella lansingensis]